MEERRAMGSPVLGGWMDVLPRGRSAFHAESLELQLGGPLITLLPVP